MSDPTASYVKLFAQIVYSTVWREPMHVKVVWITMLALSDRHGRVMASVPGLADASRVTLEECVAALERLSGPDPWSRTKDFAGARIAEIDGGWQILNYAKYRASKDMEEEREKTRVRVANHRAKRNSVTVTPGNAVSRAVRAATPLNTNTNTSSSTSTDTAADAAETTAPEPSWNTMLADNWIAEYGSPPPKAAFAALKPLVKREGWDAVAPVLVHYLGETPAEFLNVAKFASTFGEWRSRMNGGGGKRETAARGNMDVIARALARGRD